MSAELETLLAKQACTELVYRFARGLDRRDEETLRCVFHPEGTDDHGYWTGTGADFVTWVLPLLAGMERTQHLIGNVLVEVQGTRAVAESYFVASHDLTDTSGNPARMTTAGRYLDEFRKHEGQWRIFHRRAVYDWNANEPRTDNWDRSASSPRDFGKPDRSDSVFAFAERLNSPD
ncbi:nuclear transport factor 2 family protein (plasmid) [Novosphingobium resinovorum]|uniref:nuclear transport factor 2 family protein n=1 Tax=Novosphingobium TaxID=165696 RepID=UPI001B3C54FB|nr:MULTISPECIES: nuclear transport factor 2 family protein [Novosphingobium]MBF7015256.1 nuclear transport factor 2 family protein [Novosphingobium sp. HR1a]WJM29931.1 nuclear transport factor 2 family protein [Novosphingobium resinovorum]